MSIDIKKLEEVKRIMEKAMPKISIDIVTVEKNGGTMTGFMFKTPDCNYAPVAYIANTNPSANQIAYEIMNHLPELTKCDLDSFLSVTNNKSSILSNVIPKVVPLENNMEYLKDKMYTTYLNLAVIFNIQKDLGDNIGSYIITKEIALKYDISLDELMQAALINIPDEIVCTDLKEFFIKELGIPEELEGTFTEMDKLMEIFNMEDTGLYIVRPSMENISTSYPGANVILKPNSFKRIAEIFGSDLYILPSSIYEVLIIPDTGFCSSDELKKMVQEVNNTEVAPYEKLSDNVYKYIYNQNEIVIAD